MRLNEIVKQAHENATKKGFWDEPNSIINLMETQSFNSDLIEYTKTMIKTQMLALAKCEIAEGIEALRNNKYSNVQKYIESCGDASSFEENIKDSVEDEIADAIIRLCDFCGRFEIDIECHIKEKMNYNAKREHKHGKSF